MSIVKFVKVAVAVTALTAFTLPMLGAAEAFAAGNQAAVAKKDQKQVKKTAKKVAKKDTKDVKKTSAKKVAKKPVAKKKTNA